MGQKLAQHVGTCACGILLLARSHVRRAHGSSCNVRLTAIAGTRTFLGQPEDAFLTAEIEYSVDFDGRSILFITQGFVHRWRIDDLMGIEDATWIKNAFDLLQQLVYVIAQGIGYELAT